MKLLNYKQLCKEPADTMFATLNKMNEMSEVFIVGEYPDGRKFIYSPLAEVAKLGVNEIEFDSNCFNRRDGTFVVFTKDELEAYVSKLFGLLSLAADWTRTAVEAALQAQEIGRQVASIQDTVLQSMDEQAVGSCVAPA